MLEYQPFIDLNETPEITTDKLDKLIEEAYEAQNEPLANYWQENYSFRNFNFTN